MSLLKFAADQHACHALCEVYQLVGLKIDCMGTAVAEREAFLLGPLVLPFCAKWTLQLKAQCTLQDIKAVLLWVMQADAYPVGIPHI